MNNNNLIFSNMTTKLTTAFDPDVIRSLAAQAYESEKFTDTLEKISREFDYAKREAMETLKFWAEPNFDGLNQEKLAILNLDKDSISIITQIRRHNGGTTKPYFGLYSDSHDNHGSLVKFSNETGECEDMIATYKERPNVDYLVTCVENVEDIIASVQMVKEKGLRRAFIPFPLALLHNFDQNATGPYDRNLLFFIFTEVWEQVQAAKVTLSPYVKALLEFCITPVYHKEKATKQRLEGFKFKIISSTAKTYKATLQHISAVVEKHDKELRKDEEQAQKTLAITQSQPDAKKAAAQEEAFMETLGIDNDSSSGLEDVPESDDEQDEVSTNKKRKTLHPDDPLFKVPRHKSKRAVSKTATTSDDSESESHYGSDEDTSIQQSNYQARVAQRQNSPSHHMAPLTGANSANVAQAGAAIIKHAIAEGIRAQKNLLDKISDINIEALLDLAICRKGKAPQNLSPAFSDALRNSTKYEELPANIRAQMRKMQNTYGYKSFTLRLLDKKFLEKLTKPADLNDGDMIDTIDQVTGFSPFSFVTKGMTVQTVNGQEIHIPESTTEVFDMLGCMILYLKVVRERKHLLLHRFEECLLPGLQDSTQLLNQQFKTHGQTFGFQLFKQIHNITTKFINDVQTGRKLTRYSLSFDEIIHRLSTNNFYMPHVAASQASESGSRGKKKADW